MQVPLFPDDTDHAESMIGLAPCDPDLIELASALPSALRFGGSSWNYPGWAGTVWDRNYPEAALSRHGLSTYARYPLFRTVSIDRGFYRPLTVDQFAGYATQVPEDFRFVVKAPSLVADALVRDGSGHARAANPGFLDPESALRDFVEPAMKGLGGKLGVLIFQISPLPSASLTRMPDLIARLGLCLQTVAASLASASEAIVAVEVRDPEWLTADLSAALRDSGATYCLGLHAKMPPIEHQLPILRALWPGPLVCRWNLNRRHGPFGYDDARKRYEPFDRMVDPDPDTRAALARVIAGTVGAGQNAYVTLSNNAEGSAPLSTIALARAVRRLAQDKAGPVD